MNGRMKIRMIHPAFAAPDRSLRRKMSAKIMMKIQMAMNQKKKINIDQRISPKVVVATIRPPCSSTVRGAELPHLDGTDLFTGTARGQEQRDSFWSLARFAPMVTGCSVGG